jgi:hypothetical protein
VSDDEPVPKLPRGRGLKFSGPELFRIAMTLVSLVGVIVLAKPCANSVSNFVMGYPQGSGSSTAVMPGTVEPPPDQNIEQYEQLRPGMTDEEIKAAIERSKAKNAAAQGSGAAPSPSTATLRGTAVAPPQASGSANAPAPMGSANRGSANIAPPTSTTPPPKANTAPTTGSAADSPR